MKCRDIDKVVISKNAWKKKKKHTKKKPFVGLDTETENGRCFVIGATSKEGNVIKRTNDWNDFINLCLYARLDRSDNFFYNLTYDYQALLKLLPERVVREVALMDEAVINDNVKIKVIPEKLFLVTIAGKEYRFYDLAQFYDHKSLNSVAEKNLSEKKKDEDVKALSAWRYDHDEEYKERIDEYLAQDCRLCYLLAEKMSKDMEEYLVPKYFYSQASFSQQYFLENMKRDYKLPPRMVMDFALKAYNGGRFEVLKKGTTTASTYDIRSAYPHHNVLVPAMDKGEWVMTREYDERALISLFRVTASGKSLISPMKAQLRNGGVYYPIGRKDMYVNKREYETLLRYGYEVIIHEGFSYYDDEPEYPYGFLRYFYEKKQACGKDDSKYMFYKIIINGFYGKTIQLQPEKYATEEELGDEGYADLNVKDGKTVMYDERFVAGLLFNPVLAQEITGNTRSDLLDAVVHMQEDVIAFATDSITCTRVPNIVIGERLGEWDEEARDKPFTSVGSGVYFYHGGKVRFRGFGRGYDAQEVFRRGLSERIIMPVLRNNKLKQSFRSDRLGFERFNLLEECLRTVNLNFDSKRCWERDLLGVDDLLDSLVDSKPLEVDE